MSGRLQGSSTISEALSEAGLGRVRRAIRLQTKGPANSSGRGVCGWERPSEMSQNDAKDEGAKPLYSGIQRGPPLGRGI